MSVKLDWLAQWDPVIVTLTSGQVFFPLFQSFSNYAPWNFIGNMRRGPCQRILLFYLFYISIKFNITWKKLLIWKFESDFTIPLQGWGLLGGLGCRGKRLIPNTNEFKYVWIWRTKRNSKYCFHQRRERLRVFPKQDPAETTVYQSKSSEGANLDNAQVLLKTHLHFPG